LDTINFKDVDWPNLFSVKFYQWQWICEEKQFSDISFRGKNEEDLQGIFTFSKTDFFQSEFLRMIQNTIYSKRVIINVS